MGADARAKGILRVKTAWGRQEGYQKPLDSEISSRILNRNCISCRYLSQDGRESYVFFCRDEAKDVTPAERAQLLEAGDFLAKCAVQMPNGAERPPVYDETDSELKQAIREGRVELYLQPKYSLGNRHVIGAEALSRIRQRDGSILMPVDFIPKLEENGEILLLDFYIYEEVLKNIRTWKQNGIHVLPISVNFSRLHIRRDDFVQRVIVLSQNYGVDPELIEIEITESMLSRNVQRMIKDLELLQTAGFTIDIDDFGTGYSTLNMLLRAPADIVKLDKSFLMNITESKSQEEYVNCIAKLIDAADKEIVFEGVETEQQARVIEEYGYDKVQGFLFGRPIPAYEFGKTYLLREMQYNGQMSVG